MGLQNFVKIDRSVYVHTSTKKARAHTPHYLLTIYLHMGNSYLEPKVNIRKSIYSKALSLRKQNCYILFRIIKKCYSKNICGSVVAIIYKKKAFQKLFISRNRTVQLQTFTLRQNENTQMFISFVILKPAFQYSL